MIENLVGRIRAQAFIAPARRFLFLANQHQMAQKLAEQWINRDKIREFERLRGELQRELRMARRSEP